MAEEIREELDYDVIQPYGVPVSKPWIANGDFSSGVLKWYEKEEDRDLVGGPFSRVAFEPLALSKRKKLMDQLMKKGWVPTIYTDKGNPRIADNDKNTCPNLDKMEEFPGKTLAKWYTLNHRTSQMIGLLKLVREDGRIEADANTCGTNTRRFRHSGLVNIPRPKSPYGAPMRMVFTVPEGFRMVGCDASGLEVRMLCHYMQDDEYTDVLLNGDIHNYNMEILGIDDRDKTKTFFYAFLYGAGFTKLGAIIGGGMKEGKELYDTFLAGLPKLESLITRVKYKAKNSGYFVALDGGRLYMRRDDNGHIMDHKALNTLLQGAGAVVMKQAALFAEDMVSWADANMVINMHDEYQYEVAESQSDDVAEQLEESIRIAGRYMGLNVPLDAEAKIGRNWSETH